MPPLLHPGVADALARGLTLITPNQRAARAIRVAFNRSQSSLGVARWTPPAVFSLETWLAHVWHQRLLQGTELRTLLNRSQEQLLWRDLIASGNEISGLRSPHALARMAAHAWTLLCLYGGRGRMREFSQSADARAFDRWARALAQRLERDSFLTAAQLPHELAQAGHLSSPPLALVDFDFQTPALQAFLHALERSGVDIQAISTATAPLTSQLQVAQDDADELQSAAQWARHQLTLDPAASLAIVVPNLADRRTSIERVFAPILSPADVSITSHSAVPAFEFSLGHPLAQLSITRTALDLLHWTQSALSVDRISALLLSPCFSSENLNSVAAFDAFELRQLTLFRPELTLEATIKLARRSRYSVQLVHLIHRLRALHQAAESHPPRQSFTSWSEFFRTLLEVSGWTRNSSSLDFQQHRSFDHALDELATLDTLQPSPVAPPDAHLALAEFSHILDRTLFAAESRSASVQVLGPLELGGVTFDALWFLGADDLAWSAIPASSPLLPWALQRTLGMPGADRSHEDAHALALTRRVAASARHVVFSYSPNAKDGERRPSPVLAALNLQRVPPASSMSSPDPLLLSTSPDDLSLPSLPGSHVRGGAQVLKLQAACAFRAFAEYRLWSTSLDTREPGFDRREQGSLVHQVMQHFWSRLRTQDALRDLTQAQRSEHLASAINLTLADFRSKPETAWDDAYLAIQRQRLHNLLSPWLKHELGRARFTVKNSEEEKYIQLGSLNLKLRIDRIDSTPFGDVIIDYKSGDAKTSQWTGDRPDEPQLPLYAVLAQKEGQLLAGVAFALLRAGNQLSLTGYADTPAVLDTQKRTDMPAASLHEQVETWEETLSRLAYDFASGQTSVDPKDYPKTCKRCDQRILCRLNPELLSSDEDSMDDFSDLESEFAFE